MNDDVPTIPYKDLQPIATHKPTPKLFRARKAGESEWTAIVKAFPLADKRYTQEKKIYQDLGNHDNVTRLISSHDKVKVSGDEVYSALVIQYASNGDMYDYIMGQRENVIDFKLAMTIFRQIVEGVALLHGKGVAHLDLKLENVLLDDNFNVKVTDFDLSQKASDQHLLGLGTEHYRAPELALGKIQNYKAGDIFSLGVILYILVNRIPPYQEGHKRYTYSHFVTQSDKFWNEYTVKYSKNAHLITDEFRDLINRMLNPKPKKRPTIEELVNDKYINSHCYSPDEEEEYIQAAFDFASN